jgi:hypothetical protein
MMDLGYIFMKLEVLSGASNAVLYFPPISFPSCLTGLLTVPDDEKKYHRLEREINGTTAGLWDEFLLNEHNEKGPEDE